MIFLSQLVLSRTALNQRFYFVSLKLSSKKLRTGLYGSYDEDGLNSAHLTTFFFKIVVYSMLQVYPNVTDNRQAALPPGSFLTCSSDDTVRVWNIEEGDDNFCSL